MRKLKLNQVIAIETGVKKKSYEALTEAHKALQKNELFNGFNKTFTPKDDDPNSPLGERLPPENKKVQIKAKDLVESSVAGLTEFFDIAAARDWGNCEAKGDIVVDGTTILTAVPVSYLLFLEKQLNDLKTFVTKLPTLDPSETWSYDANQDLHAAPPAGTARTKKVVRPLVLYEATDKHPAQVKEVTEDLFSGTWTTLKYSSAFPVSKVNEMLRRVEKLQQAVKIAREQANSLEVETKNVGKPLLDFLFA